MNGTSDRLGRGFKKGFLKIYVPHLCKSFDLISIFASLCFLLLQVSVQMRNLSNFRETTMHLRFLWEVLQLEPQKMIFEITSRHMARCV